MSNLDDTVQPIAQLHTCIPYAYSFVSPLLSFSQRGLPSPCRQILHKGRSIWLCPHATLSFNNDRPTYYFLRSFVRVRPRPICPHYTITYCISSFLCHLSQIPRSYCTLYDLYCMSAHCSRLVIPNGKCDVLQNQLTFLYAHTSHIIEPPNETDFCLILYNVCQVSQSPKTQSTTSSGGDPCDYEAHTWWVPDMSMPESYILIR